jgi:DNA-binding transcriptional LysR family regulator
VLHHAHQILQAREDMEHEINHEKGLHGGRVRIAAIRSVATHILPSKIALFCQRFPSVEVELTESDPTGVEQALREGQVDIGLMPLPRSEEFEVWEIMQDEYVALLPQSATFSPENADANSGTLTWEILSQHSFILLNYAECTSAVRNHWTKWGQSLKVAYTVKEDSTIVSMVAQGLGAAILPRLTAMPIPDGIQVRSLPVPLARIIVAAVPANLLLSPAVFTFLDVLREDGMFRKQAS